jgi:hypothetical protein
LIPALFSEFPHQHFGWQAVAVIVGLDAADSAAGGALDGLAGDVSATFV